MNRTKIEWTEWSWNPVTGCLHGCWYCYARKLSQRFKKIFPNGFEPTFYPERLKEPYELRNPSKIFVCSIADLFAPWTPREWMWNVLTSIEWCPVKHTFQLLTKNPELIPQAYVFPDNVWVGTTVTGENNDVKNIEEIKKVQAKVRFVSFEPLLGKIEPDLKGIQWVIIGKLTGSKRVKLQDEWVDTIFKEARRLNIPVFTKNNLIPDYHGLYWMQEFPKS
jgi:protein gp37